MHYKKYSFQELDLPYMKFGEISKDTVSLVIMLVSR